MDRRSFFKSIGAFALVALMPFKPTRPREVRIAAANASPEAKAAADFVCNGKNDHEIFQLAISQAANNQVFLTEGDFWFVHPLHLDRQVWFKGQYKTVYHGAILTTTHNGITYHRKVAS